jgi:hypothetical protein
MADEKPAEAAGNLSLFFDPEDGGGMFLQNMGHVSELHSVTTQKPTFFTVTAMRAQNPMNNTSHKIILFT